MGEFGKHLAYKLKDLHHEVCVVDIQKETINELVNDFANAYVCNGMLEMNLKDLGVKNYDACIVSVGKNFQASLEITYKLKEAKAKYIISKATSENQAKFLKMAGANETVYPEKDIAEKIAMRCSANNLLDYINIANGYNIFEFKIKPSWVGKSLKNLNLRNKYGINIIAVMSATGVVLPNADYTFSENDSVYVIAKENVMQKITK